MHSSTPTPIQLFTGIAGNSSTTIWYTANPVDSIAILITFQHLRSTHQACEPLLPTAYPYLAVVAGSALLTGGGAKKIRLQRIFCTTNIFILLVGTRCINNPFDTHHCWTDTWGLYSCSYTPAAMHSHSANGNLSLLSFAVLKKGPSRRTAAVALYLATGIYEPIQTRL